LATLYSLRRTCKEHYKIWPKPVAYAKKVMVLGS
jgi:hypothetical protein